ncbi:MAG: PilZ domain-containing protein [Alphaproteobacteria bacterium]|nr:PilZ domain-containing protein [Alphaproteobacteria bacterium]
MFGNFFGATATTETQESGISRRKATRRSSDHCVCNIEGKSYPVLNWGIGGMQITADDRLFAIGQEIEFSLKFKIRTTIVEVHHKAVVVRKSRGSVAFQFEPLTRQVRNDFQNIIDDFMASEFASSQME